MSNGNAAVALERNLRRKVQAWRRSLYDLVLYFLPSEYGGVDLTDLGIMCGNTRESLEKAKGIARKAGFSADHPAFDVDGDGATTSWDVEAWLDDPSRSTVPNVDEEGAGAWDFDYGVTNGDRLMQEEYLRGELQRLRAMEMDLLHECLAGEFDKVGSIERILPRFPEDGARRRTSEFLGRAQRREGWPLAAALAAIGLGTARGSLILVGYAWHLLRGRWTQHGASEVDAAVQAAEALREASLGRWPLYNDLRRFGDQWDSSKNCPMEPPRVGTGPMRLIEDARRWGRALLDPFTRWFFCGSLLAPRVHDAAITTWWRRAMAAVNAGRLRTGAPYPVRLTRVAPVPGFSDDEEDPARVKGGVAASGKGVLVAGTTGQNGTTNGIASIPITKPADVAFGLMLEERPVPWEILKDLSGAALARVLAHNQRLGIREDLAAERAKGRVPPWTEYLTPSERGDLDEGRLTEAQGRALAADRGYSEPATKTAVSAAH